MKYVRTCASTASPQLPSGVELGKRSNYLIIYFLPVTQELFPSCFYRCFDVLAKFL
ncbi:hypothetical protein [Candidatus Sarmatiella mevalonica]|uniref:hypothetical protein n=1 Tax=Candidatus Sarmatiella mevalonica TaxID=2770581 RepID=UPI0019233E97|nr:hypothetical protein [Candidatus Sarmatiella mevalonica]